MIKKFGNFVAGKRFVSKNDYVLYENPVDPHYLRD